MQSFDDDLPVADLDVEPAVPPNLMLGKATDPQFRLRDTHLAHLRRQLPGLRWSGSRTQPSSPGS